MALTGIACAQEDSWRRLEIRSAAPGIRAIASDINNPGIIYVATEEGLYKTLDRGKSWESSGAGLIKEVNFIYIDRSNSDIIYAAAKNGLFRSQDSGMNWQRIFLGKDVLERDVASVELIFAPPKSIFIGTKSGMFFSPINRIIWQKISGKLTDANISFIVSAADNPEGLFVVSGKGLFKSDNRLSSYERLYSGFNPEPEDAANDIDSSEEEPYTEDSFFKHLAFDPDERDKLYLSGREGMLLSQDAGKSWQKRIFSGLLDEKINYALIARGRMFLATQNGVFDCEDDSCKQLYRGADFKNCAQLALDRENNLYSACDKGLYVMAVYENKKAKYIESEPGLENNTNSALLSREPGIREIQQKAIRYAEVYPEKISIWRKQARLKAFMPELDLSYDKTVFTSTSFPQGRGFVGPLDWGISLSWDLGDLIFSTEQTSIDVRSRLMVQLRDDILDEVTRLYFERRRLQLELASQDSLSPKARSEKELRLEELAASIDGLTGGYLSERLEDKK
ncbi:MAG: hypothetical protein AABZ27_01860 [Candidatus Omnitrophota bacterium]